MSEKVSPFTWVDAITQKNGDPMKDHGEKAYPAFMVNRALSYYPDTLMYAVEADLYRNLDARMAYDYFMAGIRKKKRFAKWGKKLVTEDVELVQAAYNCSRTRAIEHLRILSKDQLEVLRENVSVQ